MAAVFATPIAFFAILMLILAVGEAASLLSRAWVPSLLVSFVLYIALLWSGVIPADIVAKASGPVGGAMISIVIAHMGTMIPLNRIKEQWRGIVIALAGVIGILILVLGIGTLTYGYTTAVSGVGVVAGGIVAFLITSAKLTEIGQQQLVAVPALILGLQSLIGMPIANVMLRKYVAKQRAAGVYDGATATGADPHAAAVPAVKVRTWLPESMQTPIILLALLGVLGFLATFLDKLTGLNYGVWALLLGVGATAIGLVPPKTMEKGNSFGLGMTFIIFVVLASLNGLTPAALGAAVVPALVILAAGVVGIVIFAGLAARLVKWDPLKGMPVAMTALFGFPADYLLCQEISRSVGRDAGEREAIMEDIYTPMLIGGFTTVTLSSVLVASILIGTI